MKKLIEYINSKYGITAIPVNIIGRRWASDDSSFKKESFCGVPTRIKLTYNKGIVLYHISVVDDNIVNDIERKYYMFYSVKNGQYSKDDVLELISFKDKNDIELLRKCAIDTMIKEVGNFVYYRGIIELSNVCVLDCNYCGIRKSNKKYERYTLSRKDIVTSAVWCAKQGYGSVVLQSGERRDDKFIDFLCTVISEIKEKTVTEKLPSGLGITLSVGEQSYENYKKLFDAGAHRYLLRIETSNRELFAKLHPKEQLFESRLESLHNLKDIGYQVGSGMMIGIPGQTIEVLADDIFFLKDIDVDMVGMGPYIVHPDTPMAEIGMMDEESLFQFSLNMISALRLVCPDINIASTTALQTLNPKGREIGLTYGANVTMPNLTPVQVRKNYELYKGKPCMDEKKEECKGCIQMRVESVGREVGFDKWGDSKHFIRKLEGSGG